MHCGIYSSSETKDKVETETFEAKIDFTFANLLGKVFTMATSEVKYPIEIDWGLDGTSYVVSAYRKGDGVETGENWSPKNGTRMRQLVDISKKLIRLVKASDKDSEKLIKEIREIGETLLKEGEKPR